LHDFNYFLYTQVSFIVTKEQLLDAAKLKLKVTNSKLYDIFLLTAKANGHSPTTSKIKRKETLPKASFGQFSSFLGGGM
jgi:hypothetical protein